MTGYVKGEQFVVSFLPSYIEFKVPNSLGGPCLALCAASSRGCTGSVSE